MVNVRTVVSCTICAKPESLLQKLVKIAAQVQTIKSRHRRSSSEKKIRRRIMINQQNLMTILISMRANTRKRTRSKQTKTRHYHLKNSKSHRNKDLFKKSQTISHRQRIFEISLKLLNLMTVDW